MIIITDFSIINFLFETYDIVYNNCYKLQYQDKKVAYCFREC